MNKAKFVLLCGSVYFTIVQDDLLGGYNLVSEFPMDDIERENVPIFEIKKDNQNNFLKSVLPIMAKSVSPEDEKDTYYIFLKDIKILPKPIADLRYIPLMIDTISYKKVQNTFSIYNPALFLVKHISFNKLLMSMKEAKEERERAIEEKKKIDN